MPPETWIGKAVASACRTPSFDSRIGFGAQRGMADPGSTLALVSVRGGAPAVWAETRAGTDAAGKQDLAGAVVRGTPGSAGQPGVQVGAVALGVAAAALAVVGAIHSGRRG